MGLVLGIETSCDETAAAVVDEEFHVRSSVIESSIDQHRAFGGVVPELAGRAHVATIGPVVRRALVDAGLNPHDPAILGIAVTSGPGGSSVRCNGGHRDQQRCPVFARDIAMEEKNVEQQQEQRCEGEVYILVQAITMAITVNTTQYARPRPSTSSR